MIAGRHIEEVVGRVEVAGRQAHNERHRGGVGSAHHQAILGRQLRVPGEVAQPLARILERRDPEAGQRIAEEELQSVGVEWPSGEEEPVREPAGAERGEVGLEAEKR